MNWRGIAFVMLGIWSGVCLAGETQERPPDPTQELCYDLPASLVCWNGDRVLVWDKVRSRTVAQIPSSRFNIAEPKTGFSRAFKGTTAIVLSESRHLILHDGAAYLLADPSKYDRAPVTEAHIVFVSNNVFLVSFLDKDHNVKQIFVSSNAGRPIVEIGYPAGRINWNDVLTQIFMRDVQKLQTWLSVREDRSRIWYSWKTPYIEDTEVTPEGRARLAAARDQVFGNEAPYARQPLDIDGRRLKDRPERPKYVYSMAGEAMNSSVLMRLEKLDDYGLTLHWFEDGRLMVNTLGIETARSFQIPAPPLAWPQSVQVIPADRAEQNAAQLEIAWTNGEVRHYPIADLKRGKACHELISKSEP